MRLTRLLVLLLLTLSLGLTACGDDDDDDGGAEQPQAFEVEVDDEGVTAPETVQPGAVELRVSNTAGKRDHSAHVVSIGEGHSADEVIAAGEEWGDKGGKLPGWIRFVGGVGTTKAGGAGTAVIDLTPGEYAVFDIESDADDAFAAFTVEGEEGDGAARDGRAGRGGRVLVQRGRPSGREPERQLRERG